MGNKTLSSVNIESKVSEKNYCPPNYAVAINDCNMLNNFLISNSREGVVAYAKRFSEQGLTILLYYAVDSGYLELAKILYPSATDEPSFLPDHLTENADQLCQLNQTDEDLDSVMFNSHVVRQASVNCDLRVIRWLVQHDKIPSNDINDNAWNSLFYRYLNKCCLGYFQVNGEIFRLILSKTRMDLKYRNKIYPFLFDKKLADLANVDEYCNLIDRNDVGWDKIHWEISFARPDCRLLDIYIKNAVDIDNNNIGKTFTLMTHSDHLTCMLSDNRTRDIIVRHLYKILQLLFRNCRISLIELLLREEDIQHHIFKHYKLYADLFSNNPYTRTIIFQQNGIFNQLKETLDKMKAEDDALQLSNLVEIKQTESIEEIKEIKKEEEEQDNREKCSICIESISDRGFIVTDCKHLFHIKCLKKWEQRCGGKFRCPNCNTQIKF